MSEAIKLDDYIDETRTGNYPSRTLGHKPGGGGGGMDDVLKRLGAVESIVSEIRVQASGIAAQVPYLATKGEVREVRGDISTIAALIPYLATKDELKETRGDISAIAGLIPHLATKADLNELKADLHSLETRIIKWIIATVIASAGVAFTIAKFVH